MLDALEVSLASGNAGDKWPSATALPSRRSRSCTSGFPWLSRSLQCANLSATRSGTDHAYPPCRGALAVLFVSFAAVVGVQPENRQPGLRFVVKIDPKQAGAKTRVRPASRRHREGERNSRLHQLPPGRCCRSWAPTSKRSRPANRWILDAKSDSFPASPLNDLPAGEYTVQAVFATNPDINLPTAPGNRHSELMTVKLDPAAGTSLTLVLDQAFEDHIPKETPTHKYLAIPSKLLSAFHGRPVSYRIGVVLPPNSLTQEPNRKYGLDRERRRVRDAVHTCPRSRARSAVRQDYPRWGRSARRPLPGELREQRAIRRRTCSRSHSVWSKKTYRCVGDPRARFTCGISTGGWSSLAGFSCSTRTSSTAAGRSAPIQSPLSGSN